MKDVCADCKHEKPGNPHFCKKYGIPIWTPKVYCVSKEPERGTEDTGNRVLTEQSKRD